MAEPWSLYCSTEMSACKATPRELDDELHDAVAILESQLRSPQSMYEDETIEQVFKEPEENTSMDIELTTCDPESETIATDDTPGHERPKERYIVMIRDALLAADRPLTVSEIYHYIMEKYPYFRDNNRLHWKNSVRHNLTAYVGKFFARTKGKCKVGKSGKCPIVWKLAHEWKHMDTISTQNTIADTTQQRPEALQKKKNRKLARLKASKRDKIKRNMEGVPKLKVTMETSHSGDDCDSQKLTELKTKRNQEPSRSIENNGM